MARRLLFAAGMWLRTNAYFLLIMGSLAALNDLLSYFFAVGPFGDALFGQLLTIGPFEAHLLAAIFGAVLLRASRHPAREWNLVALAIELVLGISNLVWFPVFEQVGSVAMGVVLTAIHWVFVGGQLWASSRAPRASLREA